ncbi:hypothetical protein EJ110_NYTH56877 [Nymphaea thermarum]|nr:hypothetical protein EJ110_NYTH56877 [Nymphaea thermarum]
MDGTHIPVYVQRDGQNRWRNRKEFLSQNVLALVGFDMRFHYILAGWEGSATDARVLHSALEDNLHSLEIPHEFNVSGSRQIETKEELYNYRHSSLRTTTVERVFGSLKARFSILKNHEPDGDASSKVSHGFDEKSSVQNRRLEDSDIFDSRSSHEDFPCVFEFTSSGCIVKDRRTQKMIATGSRRATLHFWEKFLTTPKATTEFHSFGGFV